MNKERLSNFELMRIISMIMIIIWHIIMHGKMINNCQTESIKICLTIIQYFIVVHVNSFVLLSGFFESKKHFKLEKVLKIIFQVLFYSTLILLIGTKLGFINKLNTITNIYEEYLTIIDQYWFINMYLIVYILSDFLNKFINSLTYQEYKSFLKISFLIFSIIPFITGGKILDNIGYNFYHFIYLYILGSFLRKYPIKDNYHFKKMSINNYKLLLILIFCFCAFTNFSLFQITKYYGNINNLFYNVYIKINHNTFSYSSPIIIIQSICYFEFFHKIKLKNKFINYISKHILAVYLIHDNVIARTNIYKILEIDKIYMTYNHIAYMFLITILIFVVSIFIEILRSHIITLITLITKKIKIIKT